MAQPAEGSFQVPQFPAVKFTSRASLAGVVCMLGATLAFAAVNSIIKELVQSIPLVQVMVWRTSGAFLVCWLLFVLTHRCLFPPLNRVGWHIVRGVLGIAALGLLFLSFRFVPLGEATALYFASPVFVALFSPYLLGERVTPAAWVAIGAGFTGMLLIIRPNSAEMNMAALLPSGASILLALSLISSRLLSRSESTLAISFYFTAVSALAVLLAAPFSWQPTSAEHLWLLGSTGVLGGLAVVLLTEAFRLARAAIVAPLDYVGVVASVAIGVLWFKERPSPLAAIGIALIVFGGILIMRMSAGRAKQGPVRPPDATV